MALSFVAGYSSILRKHNDKNRMRRKAMLCHNLLPSELFNILRYPIVELIFTLDQHPMHKNNGMILTERVTGAKSNWGNV